jgi:hypothetical protein
MPGIMAKTLGKGGEWIIFSIDIRLPAVNGAVEFDLSLNHHMLKKWEIGSKI